MAFYGKNRSKKSPALRCKAAIDFLKKNHALKNGKKVQLSELPTYLILGPTKSGKTSLLVQSDMKFLYQEDWRATSRAVFIDTPGKYFAYSSDEANYYVELLKTIKQQGSLQQIRGLILVLSLSDIVHPAGHLRALLESIQRQLINISKFFPEGLPLFVLINKCDLLPGFSAFFKELGLEERWQIWGMHLEKHQGRELLEEWSQKFDELVHRLNSQLIFRLRSEKEVSQKRMINSFPLEMSQLKSVLGYSLKKIFNVRKLFLRGLFFTSCYQSAETTSVIIRSQDSSDVVLDPATYNRGYFIHDLFEVFLPDLPPLFAKRFTKSALKKILFYALPFVLVGFSAVLFLARFNHQIKLIHQTQKTLLTYQVLSQEPSHSSAELFSRLKTLEDLKTKTTAASLPVNLESLSPLAHQPLEAMNRQVPVAYQQALKTQLLPIALKDLESILGNETFNLTFQYEVLRCYLMLSHAIPLQPSVAFSTLQKIWRTQYSTEEQQKFQYYFQVLLNLPLPTTPLREDLVAGVRARFKQMKPVDLAQLILINAVPHNHLLSLNFRSNPIAAALLTFRDKEPEILNMYTVPNFSLIVPSLLHKVVNEALTGNEVLGATQEAVVNHPIPSGVIENLNRQVTLFYVTQYYKTWTHLIDNIKIIHFAQLSALLPVLETLGTENSPLTQLLLLIQSELPAEVAAQDEYLNVFVQLNDPDKPSSVSLNAIAELFHNLYQYLAPLKMAQDSSKEIFELTTLRLRNQGENDPLTKLFEAAATYPEPIKTWIYGIATNTWQLLLSESQHYINQYWQTTIVPQYQAQLENRFPASPVASHDISLESFIYFFAPNGVLDNFFHRFLSPFVNTEHLPWQLKTLDAENLSLFSSTLSFFQNAYQIQHLYFPELSHQPLIKFRLKSIKLEGGVRQVVFNLGGQKTEVTSEKEKAEMEFKWPDYLDGNTVKITFIDTQGDKTEWVEKGPWGLIKLLQKAHLHRLAETNVYEATFYKNDAAWTVNLTIDTEENPFSWERFSKLVFSLDL